LSDIGELVKDLFVGTLDRDKEISYWELVFLQSNANGCFYHFEDIPQVRWRWPKETWFQERLSQKVTDTEIGTQQLNNYPSR